MPDIYQQSADQIVEECREVESLGIPGVILFGLPNQRTPRGTSSLSAQGVVQRAIEAIRKANLKLLVITDVCLCEYTDHGHCGVIEHGDVANDATVAILAEQALSHARAARTSSHPSDMMDAAFPPSAKSSMSTNSRMFRSFPTPQNIAPVFTARFATQRNPRPNSGIAAAIKWIPPTPGKLGKKSRLDLEEGADMVMVKPALPYLDVIRAVREKFDVPVGAYNVSGEYAMVKAAAAKGWLDEKRVVLEILTSIQRAGASILLTYHAKQAARWLNHC